MFLNSKYRAPTSCWFKTNLYWLNHSVCFRGCQSASTEQCGSWIILSAVAKAAHGTMQTLPAVFIYTLYPVQILFTFNLCTIEGIHTKKQMYYRININYLLCVKVLPDVFMLLPTYYVYPRIVDDKWTSSIKYARYKQFICLHRLLYNGVQIGTGTLRISLMTAQNLLFIHPAASPSRQFQCRIAIGRRNRIDYFFNRELSATVAINLTPLGIGIVRKYHTYPYEAVSKLSIILRIVRIS